jgi:hypothetical protein
VEETKARVLKVMSAIPQSILYSTTGWYRIMGDDKCEIRHSSTSWTPKAA